MSMLQDTQATPSCTRENPQSLAEPINITLQPPIKRGHRHRRSAAISGDFDSSSFLQQPFPNSLNLSKSLPCSPIKPAAKSINHLLDFPSNNNNSGSTNSNTTPVSNVSSSTPLRFYLTDETKYIDSDPNIPDALINLDDIVTTTSNLSTSFPGNLSLSLHTPNNKLNKKTLQNQPQSNDSHYTHLPKHSLLCSPKKSDVMTVEKITEENNSFTFGNELSSNTDKNLNSNPADSELSEGDEENDEDEGIHNHDHNNLESIIPKLDFNSLLMSKNLNNSLTSIRTKNSNNSSTNSLNSNPNPFSNLNTSSISSLKGKVRYQSYYNMAPTTPKNNNVLTNQISMTHINLNNRLSNSVTLSPSKPVMKSPFQYQSLQYDLPEDFHEKNNILDHSLDENDILISNNNNTITTITDTTINNNNNNENIMVHSSKEVTSSNLLKDANLSSTSVISNKSTNNNKDGNKKLQLPSSKSSKSSKHGRSSSLFSIFSKKISHHKRKSSVLSTYSPKKSSSLIEQSSDELLGLNISNLNIKNDTTLHDDHVLTPYSVGEPGPMIEIVINDDNQCNINKNGDFVDRNNNKSRSANRHHPKSKSVGITTNSSTTNSNTTHDNHHNKKGIFGWLNKSKKQHNNANLQ